MKVNALEEIVAIQLGIHFWPGQVQLKPEDLGKKPDEIPEIFYLGNKKLYPEEWRKLFRQVSGKARTT